MSSATHGNDASKLYVPGDIINEDRTTPTGQALGYLADAWQALDALEASLSRDLQRWDAKSLMTARKGTRSAWLALSNLSRSLNSQRCQSQDDGQL
jgi:hypothetical protein